MYKTSKPYSYKLLPASGKEDRTPLSLTHKQQIIPITKIWTILNANTLLNDNVSQDAARLLELLIKHRSVSGVTASSWMCGACQAVVMTENSLPAQEPYITPVSAVVVWVYQDHGSINVLWLFGALAV